MTNKGQEQGQEIRLNEKQIQNMMRLVDNTNIFDGGKTGRFFTWLDLILGKATLLLLWTLEVLGAWWIWQTKIRFDSAIDLMVKATTPEAITHARAVISAVKTSAESTNGIVIAFCAGLPGVIGAVKAARKIFKEKNEVNGQGTKSYQDFEGA